MEWRKICDHNLTTKILKEPILTPFSPCIWQEKWRKIKANIDVVSLHQAGFDSAVASLGTSLTPEQARLLSRYTNQVIIAYDNDGAGIKAAQRAIGILEKLDAVKFAYENHKLVAAICAGPTVLAQLGITDGKNATCYPGCEEQMGEAVMVPDAAAVTDGNVITGTSAGCAIPFALQLITALKGKEAADRDAQQIVIR